MASRCRVLARSWEESSDGRVRTWHLRDDVHWHDGERLTAHDAKFTFDLCSQPDVEALAGNLDVIYFLNERSVPALQQDDRFGIYYRATTPTCFTSDADDAKLLG